MANYLAQFQTIKNSCDHIVIAVEDVSDLWPGVKSEFEQRLPFKRAVLNNKTRNPVFLQNLPAEFILTTDSRLRSRFPQEQSLFWFREPYATVVFVTCEDLDEFKTILKPRLKLIVQNEEREWFVVFVSRAHPSNDNATKLAKKVYAKLEVEFSSKKRERCCKYDIDGPEANFWEDLESKVVECVRNTLDRRVQFYEDEIRKLSEQRFMPIWNFCNFFILKESLAFMFEMAHLHEDALREYDELELCYLEAVNIAGKQRDFGGVDEGDDRAALLDPESKSLTQIAQDDSFREFEFRQYMFACQSKLLFKLKRPFEVASRGYSFIISFSSELKLHENVLPFCMREVWVITACLALINATASHYDELVAPDIEKEFYRLQGDLYSSCRNKFMRLAYLVGFGTDIERSPVNSPSLSMLPWPKPAVRPSVPPDASPEVLVKEKIILQATTKMKHFGIQRKPLPLEPSVLLREANRRRSSLSAGNMFEMFDGRANLIDGSASDASSRMSPLNKVNANSMARTISSPINFDASIDRPMRLAEIYVAAEHALKHTISDPDLCKSLSSVEEFEKKYLELTKGAAENFHRSWWKRHGVVLDGEIAAVCFRLENFDLAAKSYEKVCALYAGEGWEELFADVLPNLAECQKMLNDQAGYLSSCVRLLSLDKGLFLMKERQAFQSEVVRLAHSEMKDPVPLDVSSLITFSGNPGPPLELCDGDPGALSVTVWSGFPDEITVDSLNLTLTASFNADEGAKPLRSSTATVLKPGRNTITVALPPQKPGSYILGVLTGQIGQLIIRSHSFSKGGPADGDDFMSYEKPTRPILKVFKPRPLVDLVAAISSALLINETQWVGIVVQPIDYSLKGAVLHIDTGPGLKIEDSHIIEMESCDGLQSSPNWTKFSSTKKDSALASNKEIEQLTLQDGRIEFPVWASDVHSVLWIPVRAINDGLPRGSSSVTPQRPSIVDGMRTIALKLEFGVSRNQIFERTVAVHFTDPFHVSTRVADKCNGGTLLLQVTLHSQVKATMIIYDAWLELQDGFVHTGQGDGRPSSGFFPLMISPTSRAGILFSICLGKAICEVRRRELTSEERLEVVQLLLKKSVNGVLPRTATGDVAYQFGVGIRSIQRVWKRAQDSGNNAYQNNRVRNCGRKRVQFDLERMRSIPLSKRTTIRSLAYALGVSKSFLYNKLKEGVIRRHSNAIKPSLTAENHMERVNHVLSSFEPSSVPHDPTFSRMANTVHIDEKWFYLTKKCQTYYLLQDEIEPVRTIKSSHFIPKVMFLAAVARPRYDSDGLCTFDGKIGIFPLIQSVAAVRSSQNRPRGTVEIKPIANITREVIREFMVNKLLPAIACRWPGESISEAIYIQQDNAKTHIHTDDIDFLCAVEESGMNVSLVCQPPNSPDLNVLDLGFFRAIQSLQNKECAKSIVELIGAVEHAYQEFSDKKSNKVFLTLQSCMLEILKCDGNNNYKIPHIGKDHLDRQGTLPSVLHCSPELYANAVAYMT